MLGFRDQLRRAQHRLRRHARPVGALTADEPALDDGDLRFVVEPAEGADEVLARRPSTENDHLHHLRPFAFRNAEATFAADCLSTMTALFMATIAFCVNFADTAFTVVVNFAPSDVTTVVLTIGAAFWKPVTCFGSASTVYFEPLPSGGSVENTSAARMLALSSAA